MRFPLISVFGLDTWAVFVFIPRREEKLVNILASVDAWMPILDINTDETRNKRGMHDVKNSLKLQVEKGRHTFFCYTVLQKNAKNRDINLKFGICV